MSDDASFPIVALGASAGGVEALEQFFHAVPGPMGMAFVVIIHLDAHRESLLVDILRRHIQVPVMPAQDGSLLAPDHVYVLQPGTILTVEQGRLRVHQIEPLYRETNPIDIFFSSLAEDQGERAIGIVLSGTGSDGTLGLKAIKERGGITLAQGGDHSAPRYGGMPGSAVAAGMVDLVLPVEAMPVRLLELGSTLQSHDLHPAETPGDPVDAARRIICEILQSRTGHDFSGYKPSSFLRRVHRRMELLQIATLDGYVAQLRQAPEEAPLLLHDLLIGVTGFFRDPSAFEILERAVIPRLFEGKGLGDVVRVWVPGCATGEEAYSIAMLLCEHMATLPSPPRVQVFASDIDRQALVAARAGRYPAPLLKDMSPARLRRFFAEEHGSYCVTREIRDLCIFSAHSVIRDPPFSRVDLVSCRNLLIYLGRELQDRVLPIFHYALRPGGFLFLGTAENVAQHSELFAAIDKTQRIYQRRELPGAQASPLLAMLNLPMPRPAADPPINGIAMRRAAELRVLERFAPAHVVVDAQSNILYVSSRTGRYLELPSGVPTRHLLPMARRGLRLGLRAALQEAVETRHAVTREPLAIEIEGGTLSVSVTVEPLQGVGSEALFLVLFRELAPVQPPDSGMSSARPDEGEEHARELRETRERLQATIEEYETAVEELKSSNEELMSLNEELQSANEELQTSKEELQSINEELHTVNLELHSKIEQLDRANSDLRNLFDSTRIATVFLDRTLIVRNFTPAASEIFHLIPSDRGRPLTDIATRLDQETIGADCRSVLARGEAIERQVRRREDGARYLMRVQPYLSSDNAVDGLVLTFVDITRMAEAEERQRRLLAEIGSERARLRALLEQIPVGILLAEAPSGRLVFASAAVEQMFGPDWPRSESIAGYGEWGAHRADGTPYTPEETPLARALRGEEVRGEEMRFQRGDGSWMILGVNAAPVRDGEDRILSAMLACEDITAERRTAEHQELLLAELNHRVKNMLAVVIAIATETLARSRRPEEFQQSFVGRIEAMAKTYSLLTRDQWGDVGLADLVREEVAPYAGPDGARLRLEGPPALLAPKAALAFGMVLHELATNAVKYGALSVPEGHVAVSWTLVPEEGAPCLVLTWREEGGPEVGPPSKRGFGSDLIEQTVSYELGGRTTIEYFLGGLRAHLSIPLASGMVVPEADRMRGGGGGRP